LPHQIPSSDAEQEPCCQHTLGTACNTLPHQIPSRRQERAILLTYPRYCMLHATPCHTKHHQAMQSQVLQTPITACNTLLHQVLSSKAENKPRREKAMLLRHPRYFMQHQYPAPSSQAKKQLHCCDQSMCRVSFGANLLTPTALKTATKMPFNRCLSPCAEALLKPAFHWYNMCAGLCSMVFPTTRRLMRGVGTCRRALWWSSMWLVYLSVMRHGCNCNAGHRVCADAAR